jgi:hypothetical protein
VSTEAKPAETDATALQFDKAEFAEGQSSRTCALCRREIHDQYFEARGNILCTPCSRQVSGADAGKGAFLRAFLHGGLAAGAGTIVWALIIYLTGYELGIIAIAVGVAVGMAVRKGARGRSGWRYQTLAMVLTYVSITSSYVPTVFKALAQGANQKATTAASDKPQIPVAVEGESKSNPAAPATNAPNAPHVNPALAVLIALAVVWGLALAAPFLAGVSNIMGIIIIGIGLYEAWKLNRRVLVTGPFALGPQAAPTPPPAIST